MIVNLFSDIRDPSEWITKKAEQQRMEAVFESVFKKLKQLNKELLQAKKELETSSTIREFYKESLEVLTYKYLNAFSDLLTEVYQKVFDDTDKSILDHGGLPKQEGS